MESENYVPDRKNAWASVMQDERRLEKEEHLRESFYFYLDTRKRYKISSIHAIKNGTEAMLGWKAHGPRINTELTHPSEHRNIKVIQYYASTNDSDEETKDEFYSRLQSILDKCREKYVIILMGDFNAKIETDNSGYEEMMGTQGVTEMNENGERFGDTCALNNITIGGSIKGYTRPHEYHLIT